MKTIGELNAMGEDEFVEYLGGVYEKSPWIAKATWGRCPHPDVEDLVDAMREVVDSSGGERQLELIQAHPDLGGKLAVEGDLTPESRREQSRLGLESLGEEEFARFSSLNDAYVEKFGFPFILCVGLVDTREEILDAFEARLGNGLEEEKAEALRQIHLIAGLRVRELVGGRAKAKLGKV